MSRHEADREDLMREATALRERVELSVSGEYEPVVAGFRDDGRLSIYFGADPVYHFDRDGRLRRAFCGGDLYRSQGTTLARLRRVRSNNSTTLHRHDLDSEELRRFLDAMRDRLQTLLDLLKANRVAVLREAPSGSGVVSRLIDRLPSTCRTQLSAAFKR